MTPNVPTETLLNHTCLHLIHTPIVNHSHHVTMIGCKHIWYTGINQSNIHRDNHHWFQRLNITDLQLVMCAVT